MDAEIEEQVKRIRSGAEALVKAAELVEAQMREALDGEVELPERCPSREAYARYILRGISKPMSEVSLAFKRIDERLEGEEG